MTKTIERKIEEWDRITLSKGTNSVYSDHLYFNVVGGRFESPADLYPTSGMLKAFVSSNVPIGDPPVWLISEGMPSFHLAQKLKPVDYCTSRAQAEEKAYQLALNFAREMGRDYKCPVLIDNTS